MEHVLAGPRRGGLGLTGFGGCPACTCCLGMRAEVTAFDLLRLVDALGVDPLALVEPSPHSAGNETSFYLDASGRAFVPALRRLADPHRCSLLVGPLGGGEYRCGVYPVRPLVCRAYPFELDSGALALRDPVACPAGSWAATPDADRVWRPLLRRQTAETDAQRWIVRRWNLLVLTAPGDGEATFADHVGWLVTLARAGGPALEALTADEHCTEAWGRHLDTGASPLDPRVLGRPPSAAEAGVAQWWDGLQRLGALIADAPPPGVLAGAPATT